jgi:hypothetical protein
MDGKSATVVVISPGTLASRLLCRTHSLYWYLWWVVTDGLDQ